MTQPSRDTYGHAEELTDRISWIMRLRWFAAAGVAGTVWSVPRLLDVHLAQQPLYLVAGALALYNAVLWAVTRWLPDATRGAAVFWFANLQISVDLIFLTALLHFAGGIENPFICYFVFHIVIASILLSRRATYVQAAIAVALLLAMGILESTGQLPHYHLTGLDQQELFRRPTYIFSILFAVGTMLALTAFMATSITARLRAREAEVSRLSAQLGEHAADLGQAYDALQGLEKERSEYMHRVAHDLRSPLATVERMLAVIAEGRTGEISDKARKMLGRARLRVHHLLDLGRDLLALSRAREAHRTTPSQIVRLDGILAAVEEEVRQRAEAASVSLVTRVALGLTPVSGDSESLGELLENLIDNGIKYTPEGGKVSVDLQQRSSHVEIRVSDTGIGIPPGERESIFDDFFRASNARESGKQGSGLGLSIVKAIAVAHRGTVDVHSEVGFGTTFRVLLPAASPADKPRPPEQQEVQDTAQTGTAGPSGPSISQVPDGEARNDA